MCTYTLTSANPGKGGESAFQSFYIIRLKELVLVAEMNPKAYKGRRE